MNALRNAFAASALVLTGACGSELDLVATEAALRTPAFEKVTPEVAELLNWMSYVPMETLRDHCQVPSDAARAIQKRAPYEALEHLASVPEVGTATLQRIVHCGHVMGPVPQALLAVLDQNIGTRYDVAVAFTTAEAARTLDFANRASQKELEAADGIGSTLAARIVAARPMGSIFNVRAVEGIDVVRIKGLKAAAAAWTPPPPPPPVNVVTGPSTSSPYVLTVEDATAFTTTAVNEFTFSMDAQIVAACEGVWGGEAFTDEWSNNHCRRYIKARLYEDTLVRSLSLVEEWFTDWTYAQEAIDALVEDQYYSSLDWYLEAWAEAIGEASA